MAFILKIKLLNNDILIIVKVASLNVYNLRDMAKTSTP